MIKGAISFHNYVCEVLDTRFSKHVTATLLCCICDSVFCFTWPYLMLISIACQHFLLEKAFATPFQCFNLNADF